MTTMTDDENKSCSSKQKAAEIDDQFQAFEDLSTILNGHIITSTKHMDGLNEVSQTILERIESLQKEVLDLREQLDACRKTGGFSQDAFPDEDVSDIEEDDGDNSPWEKNFRSLRAYTIEHGHPGVSQKENAKLNTWIKNQKFAYANFLYGKNGTKLNPEKIQKLESLEIAWGKKFPPPKSWEEMYEDLVKFKERMGHCRVPFHAANPSPLAKWVGFQRNEFKRFKHGRPHLIQPDQIDKLREIGFQWKGPAV